MIAADVSVVIPTHNRPKLLEQAVASAFAQTRAAAEIIVVDNGSQAPAEGVLRHYGNRVQYVRQSPMGVQVARNTGFSKATCSWVATLDDDDLYRPDFLQAAAPAMADDRVDIIFADHRKFDDAPALLTNYEAAPADFWDGICEVRNSGWSFIGRFPVERLLKFIAFYPSTMIIRRKLFERIGGYDPAVRGIVAEDIDFLVRALDVGRLAIVWDVGTDYRLHDANDSLGLMRQRIGRWRIFQRLSEVYRGRNVALDRALANYLPKRRKLIYKMAYRAGDVDLMREVFRKRAKGEWSRKRRIRHVLTCSLPALLLPRKRTKLV